MIKYLYVRVTLSKLHLTITGKSLNGQDDSDILHKFISLDEPTQYEEKASLLKTCVLSLSLLLSLPLSILLITPPKNTFKVLFPIPHCCQNTIVLPFVHNTALIAPIVGEITFSLLTLDINLPVIRLCHWSIPGCGEVARVRDDVTSTRNVYVYYVQYFERGSAIILQLYS